MGTFLGIILMLIVIGAFFWVVTHRTGSKPQLTLKSALRELREEVADFEPGEAVSNADNTVFLVLEKNDRRLAIIRLVELDLEPIVVRPDDVMSIQAGKSRDGKPSLEIKLVEYAAEPVVIVFESQAAAKSWFRKLKKFQNKA